MRNIFPGFYSPTEDDLDSAWNSKDTLFVFDTNTLLNLYGYASQTRKDFFSILKVISDRIWIPYHVGLEYQRRRLGVVRNEKAIFNKIEQSLSNIDKIFDAEFSILALERRFPELFNNTEKLHKDIKKLISSYKKSVTSWDKKQSCVKGHDSIREELNIWFEKKVGDRPENQKKLNEIFIEGEIRYKNNVPPGYKDVKKAGGEASHFSYAGLEYERQYGDLLIWKELIEKAKQDDIKNVFFITDDAKEDWWYIIDSSGKKNIGPRAELREEICREGNIELFSMYNTSDFLISGEKLLKIDVKKESIDDASNAFLQQSRVRNAFENSSAAKSYNKNLFDSFNRSKEAYDLFNKSQNAFESFNNTQNAFDLFNRSQNAIDSFNRPQNVIDSLNISNEAYESFKKIAEGYGDLGQRDIYGKDSLSGYFDEETKKKILEGSFLSRTDGLEKYIEIINKEMKQKSQEDDGDENE